MNKLAIGLVVLGLATGAFAQDSTDMSQINESVFVKKQKFDNEGVELYSSNYDLKATKEFGIGLNLGGATGLLALNGEINLEPAEALVIGLGFGPGYGTFGLGWKHNFEGNYISPYTKVSYSKWFSSTSGSGSAADSDVLKRLFSDADLTEGNFDADFIVGAAGVEYNQLEGELSGVNFFGEVNMMLEPRKFTFIPTGSIGLMYYY